MLNRGRVRPVIRPERVFGNLTVIAHRAAHDLLAIDRVGERAPYLDVLQDRMAEVEDERDVVGPDRRVGHEALGADEELHRVAVHFRHHVDFTAHHRCPPGTRVVVGRHLDLLDARHVLWCSNNR